MRKYVYSLIATLAILALMKNPTQAQYVLKEADAEYQLYDYIKAIDLYEQAYQKKATLYAAERLGECYEQIRDYKQTESWYAIAAGMTGSKPENTLNYAKALQNNSKYNEAKVQYQKYGEQNKSVTAAQESLWLRSCDSALKWMQSPGTTEIKNEKGLNSPQSDWGVVAYKNNIVFVSDRGSNIQDKQGAGRPFLKFDGSKVPDKEIYGWTGNHYLRLYTQDGKTDSIKMFPLNAGTDYHVGPASFTADGNEVYFTLTRIPKKPIYVNGKLATVNLEVFWSKKDENGNWGSPVGFKYNNVNQYSVGDPYVTKDGKNLYFASNMPGGLGGTDLYVSIRGNDGSWGTPRNLKEVNTEGNERTPAFSDDNTFYFSSDGRVGMGGLDIFKAEVVNGSIGMPRNMGYPVNSPQDDFAYNAINVTSGYLSSNRVGGLGEDDIYSFKQQLPIFRLSGTVYDRKTNLPLSNAIVNLNRVGSESLKVETNGDGKFKFNLEKESDYKLSGEKTGYWGDTALLTTKGLTKSTEIVKDLYLGLVEINKPIRLENIYYNFDKSDIRPDAKVELDKLVKILNDNPTIWIELGSHTDSRGKDAYNMVLSQKRAESAVQYIISRGISKNRISAKGYGETQLLNRCANGVQCSEAEHQLNRRTEFKIVKQ